MKELKDRVAVVTGAARVLVAPWPNALLVQV